MKKYYQTTLYDALRLQLPVREAKFVMACLGYADARQAAKISASALKLSVMLERLTETQRDEWSSSRLAEATAEKQARCYREHAAWLERWSALSDAERSDYLENAEKISGEVDHSEKTLPNCMQ